MEFLQFCTKPSLWSSHWNRPLSLTLMGMTVSTSPRLRLAPRGSKLTTKSTVSWSGAPGRFFTLSSSTVNPCSSRCSLSTAKEDGNHPVLVARTTWVRTVPNTTWPKSSRYSGRRALEQGTEGFLHSIHHDSNTGNSWFIHYSKVTWMSWCLKSPANPLFAQQLRLATKNTNALLSDCSIFIANELDLPQLCAKPLISWLMAKMSQWYV